jgi:hypothetical protein
MCCHSGGSGTLYGNSGNGRTKAKPDHAVDYAKFFSRSHHTVIRVYDEAGNVIETHEHVGDFKRAVSVTRKTKSRHALKRDG